MRILMAALLSPRPARASAGAPSRSSPAPAGRRATRRRPRGPRVRACRSSRASGRSRFLFQKWPGSARQLPRHPGEIELQARQGLAEFVMYLARHPGALLFAHVLQVGVERPQLLVGVAQIFLGALAFAALLRLANRPLHS